MLVGVVVDVVAVVVAVVVVEDCVLGDEVVVGTAMVDDGVEVVV